MFIRSYTYGTPKSTHFVTLRSSRLGLASRACPSFAERPRAPQKLRAGEPAGWLGGFHKWGYHGWFFYWKIHLMSTPD